MHKKGRVGPRAAGATLLFVAIAMAGVGCGGRGEGRPPSAGSATATGSASGPAFCEEARELLGRLGSVVDQGRWADPTAAAAVYRELAGFLETAATVGPNEIRADAAAAAGVLTEYYEALQRAALAPEGIPPATSAKLHSEPFIAGMTRVADYSRATCGLAD